MRGVSVPSWDTGYGRDVHNFFSLGSSLYSAVGVALFGLSVFSDRLSSSSVYQVI